MYLKVFRLSDIITGSGNNIAQQFWVHPVLADTTTQWPTTMPPTLMAWNLWRQALLSALHLGRNQRLAIPLGRWFAQPLPSGWYFQTSTVSLWEVQGTQWLCHGSIPNQTRQICFHTKGEPMIPPPIHNLAKATITKTGQKFLLTGYKECDRSPLGVDPCHQLRSSNFSQQWKLRVQLEGSQREFLHQLSEGLGYAISDGSFKAESGAAAWLIEGSNATPRLVGSWHTPGDASDHSSFRSEVAGILGVLYLLTYFPPTSPTPTFRLACDGLSVVNRLQNPRPIEPTKPHADILIAAKNLLGSSMYKINLIFVHGHQDTGYPIALTRDAWLNVEADSLAKETVNIPFVSPDFYKLPGNSWACYMAKRRIIKQLDLELRQLINSKDALSYWSKCKQWDKNTLQDVDWMSVGRAMREVPLAKRRWASKQMTGHFAHGANMVCWQQRSSAACPRCNATTEDKHHVSQ